MRERRHPDRRRGHGLGGRARRAADDGPATSTRRDDMAEQSSSKATGHVEEVDAPRSRPPSSRSTSKTVAATKSSGRSRRAPARRARRRQAVRRRGWPQAAARQLAELTGQGGRGRHRPAAHRGRLGGRARGPRAAPRSRHHRRAGHLRGHARPPAAIEGYRRLHRYVRGVRRRTARDRAGRPRDPVPALQRRGRTVRASAAGQPGRHPRAGARQGHHHRRRHPGEPARHRAAHHQDPAADRLGRQGPGDGHRLVAQRPDAQRQPAGAAGREPTSCGSGSTSSSREAAADRG